MLMFWEDYKFYTIYSMKIVKIQQATDHMIFPCKIPDFTTFFSKKIIPTCIHATYKMFMQAPLGMFITVSGK